ncbi:MAG: cation:proton antiporter, partial [Planctomycetales bacterium]|nr:cation:proton antiporter [Planctomycetales bacterium]
IVIDPIGALPAVLVFEAVRAGGATSAANDVFYGVITTIIVGGGLGVVSGWLMTTIIKNYLVPDYLQNAVSFAMVVVTFALCDSVQKESGLLATTVMGVYLANQKSADVEHILEFKENLRVLLISVLFLVLSSRVELGLEQFQSFGIGGWLFIAAMILLVRPVAVFLSTVGSELNRNERLLLGWIHPRGIVAAAVASLLATKLGSSRYAEEANLFVLTTFMVIVGTVVVYGLTLGPVARRLGLSRENPQGVLFAGGSPMVRDIALSLKAEGFETLVVDTNADNIAAARMAGLAVYYGSIGSERMQEDVDLGGIGRLLAMTPNDEVNSIAAMEFTDRLGSANVFQLAPHEARERHQRVPHHRRGRILFREGVTYEELQKRFAAKAVIKKTTLSEDFTIEQFRAKYPSALVLFTIPEKGRLRVSVVGHKLEPKPGKKLVALISKEEAEASSESGVLA